MGYIWQYEDPTFSRTAIFFLLLVLSMATTDAQEKQPPEINTLLMESTFRIEGRNGKFGAAFVLGQPIPDQPERLRYVLITAAHVLDDIEGETAILVLRRKDASNAWQRIPSQLKIREGQRPLWTKHPQADVAVMYIRLPEGVVEGLLPIGLLADDSILRQFEVHPGDKLYCLGFPLGAESNAAGFPILRSGTIASYPLLPASQTKTFLLDFQVYPGNSGGPVYLQDSNRIYGGATVIGTVRFVIGLVSRQKILVQQIELLNEKRQQSYTLGLAEVVHASLIREAIELLPPPQRGPEAQESPAR